MWILYLIINLSEYIIIYYTYKNSDHFQWFFDVSDPSEIIVYYSNFIIQINAEVL